MQLQRYERIRINQLMTGRHTAPPELDTPTRRNAPLRFPEPPRKHPFYLRAPLPTRDHITVGSHSGRSTRPAPIRRQPNEMHAVTILTEHHAVGNNVRYLLPDLRVGRRAHSEIGRASCRGRREER